MRITRIDRLEAFWKKHPDAERALMAWMTIVQAADWKTPVDVKNTLGAADVAVRVPSGRNVVVFDIRGNHYRLIATIDYRLGVVNVHDVLTHREYDKEKWKQSI